MLSGKERKRQKIWRSVVVSAGLCARTITRKFGATGWARDAVACARRRPIVSKMGN